MTVRAIETASTKARVSGKDVWLTDPAARGQGRFTLRCTPSGACVFMFRHTRAKNTRDILKVGNYDLRGINGLTLSEAREKAGELARLAAGGNSLRTLIFEQDQVKVAADDAVVVAKRKAEQASLAALLQIYVGTLEGRQSHDDAQSIFKLHVIAPFPDWAAHPAAQVKAEDLREMLARLINAGKGRTAAKLRAYHFVLRMAWRCAQGLTLRCLKRSPPSMWRAIPPIGCQAWRSFRKRWIAPSRCRSCRRSGGTLRKLRPAPHAMR